MGKIKVTYDVEFKKKAIDLYLKERLQAISKMRKYEVIFEILEKEIRLPYYAPLLV
ncbi:hypothetical protein [Bacillus thuringiensis]|uniref:hypothetical protein n=1 Tax=Bacillus thuringiensis TaxID=1428 RepID=UPI00197A7CF5|nr:hypothetical protein [Bacillus thuringiensis]